MASNYRDYGAELAEEASSTFTDYGGELVDDSAGSPDRQKQRGLGAGSMVKEMITGDNRSTFETRTAPRITQISDRSQGILSQLWDDMRVAKLFMTSSSAQEFAKGYNRIYPGSEAITDEKGNMFIVNGATGEMGQVNKPGVDFTDVLKTGSEIAKYAPVARTSSLARAGLASAGIATVNEALSEDFQMGQVAVEGALGTLGAGIARIPAAVRRSKEAMTGLTNLRRNNQKLAETVERWLTTKADDTVMDVTPARARQAANNAYNSKIKALQEEAKPLYNAANRANPSVNLDGPNRVYETILREYPEGTGFHKAAKKAMGIIRNAKTFQQLNGAKKELDSMIRPPAVGETGYSREVRAVITRIRQELVKAMDKASPEYKQARAIYSEGLTEAGLISDGVVGRLARIKDSSLEDISRTLFNQNPRAIKQTAKILEKADPGVMEDLAYLELRDRFDSITRFSVEEIADKPSRIMGAILPSKKSQGLLEVLPDDTRAALKKFERLMRKADDLKPDARRDVIGQGLWAPLGLPYRAARKARAVGGIVRAQNESVAILEALTNRESLNSSLMKQFMDTPLTNPTNVKKAFQILTQLSNEIAAGVQSVVREQEEAPPNSSSGASSY